jgi:hypothetical protein
VSYSKNRRVGLAIGVFLVLSLVVFGSIFYVAYSATNTEIIAFESGVGDGVNEHGLEPTLVGGPIETVPCVDINHGFRTGPIILPF